MQYSNVFRFKQFTIVQDNAAMKVGTDSDLLGALAHGGHSILDIGTGTGVLSLMMAQRFPDASVTAVEIDENAIKDATVNFSSSPFADRISLIHSAFQDFSKTHPKASFDCIICNPPYFDKSLECDNTSRSRARHTSSLPFDDLINGAFDLLCDGGVFSVCIPPEVHSDFTSRCIISGFWPLCSYDVKSVPEKPTKRYILVFRKGKVEQAEKHTFCMRNADRTVSDWYKELMKDFLIGNL